ncbi:hypothetical protein G7Z17_g10208 [Cylindrodendrum hubeiense]|uniref:Short-chain dehydrogenase/reductase n=1 Tax=Cylindrodendrum hubeiense TaxID=595255 RepID=A0A9P5H345_9HYPO|nr:hypothetical protein G7Z17_g10208 [Cylindrodendrum hubeiense]
MSRYAAAHIKPEGPGDARPTALQIVKDEGAEGQLQDHVIVITGTSSGIGIETVRALAATGATLYLTARDLAKAKSALDGIFEPSHMELFQMDQGSLSSVRAAAAAILVKTSKIHALVNNAGIMALIKPALLAAASPALSSRVVNVSSAAHNLHGINDADNYAFQRGDYDPNAAYGQSKTANIYMANEIERRYGAHHLHATSLHPGLISTGLARFLPPDAWKGMDHLLPLMKSVEQGAATTVWAAVGKLWEHEGGKYLVDCTVAEPGSGGEDKMVTPTYATYAYDAEEEGRLWRDSLKLVGLADGQ